MKVGDRVYHARGVGIIEAVDNDERWPNADVRWLTPDNEPSCLSSLCAQADLQVVGDNVLPQPRSKAWKRESKAFCDACLQAVIGKLGEYANVRKKFERGDLTAKEFAAEGGKELAGVKIYLDAAVTAAIRACGEDGETKV